MISLTENAGAEGALLVRAKSMYLPEQVRAASLWIRAGRIERIAAYDAAGDGRAEIDAGDLHVMPGLVDTHVHVNDPGRAEWEGFASATRAAAAGGVTTLVDMPLNSIPATLDARAVEQKLAALSGNGYIDVGLCGGLVPENAGKIADLVKTGVLAIKCFTCDSGVAEFAHVSADDLARGMKGLQNTPLLVHAEWPDQLARAEAALGPLVPGQERTHQRWLRSRPMEAEEAAVRQVFQAAAQSGARAHIVHLSASSALPILREAIERGVQLTAETCPHYLSFSAEEIPEGRTEFKCAPPIREAYNRELLWDAVREGLVSQVVSDHSPSTLALKCCDSGDFVRAWGGISSLQIGLSVLASQAIERGMSLHALVQRMSAAPAALVGLSGKKGALQVGCDADFFFWDASAELRVDAQALQHKNPLTPYQDRTARGVVVRTFLRGREIYRKGPSGAQFAAPAGRWLRA